MMIRNATYHDAPAIKSLLEQLGPATRLTILINQLETIFDKEDNQVVVYEMKKEVAGFVSAHYLPRLAYDGGLTVISYLSVDEAVKDTGIARELEQYITNQAKIRKCGRIQVHCMDWRTPAHQFFEQQGYLEYLKYFTKRLAYMFFQ
jgi:N-acetylglutamate synthase-like GNAT family acetyltransferase